MSSFYIRVRIMGYEMLVFWKVFRMYYMDDPRGNFRQAITFLENWEHCGFPYAKFLANFLNAYFAVKQNTKILIGYLVIQQFYWGKYMFKLTNNKKQIINYMHVKLTIETSERLQIFPFQCHSGFNQSKLNVKFILLTLNQYQSAWWAQAPFLWMLPDFFSNINPIVPNAPLSLLLKTSGGREMVQ